MRRQCTASATIDTPAVVGLCPRRLRKINPVFPNTGFLFIHIFRKNDGLFYSHNQIALAFTFNPITQVAEKENQSIKLIHKNNVNAFSHFIDLCQRNFASRG
jgi:hypothetical protein